MTMNFIETLKTSIYNPKYTKQHENTFSTFPKNNNNRKSIFLWKMEFKKLSCPLISMARLWRAYNSRSIYCWRPRSLTNFRSYIVWGHVYHVIIRNWPDHNGHTDVRDWRFMFGIGAAHQRASHRAAAPYRTARSKMSNWIESSNWTESSNWIEHRQLYVYIYI